MKHLTKRLLALMLAGGTLFSLAACANGKDNQETEPNGTTEAVEEDTRYKPEIGKTNYNEEFVMLNCSSILDDELFWVDESKRGDAMADSVYERAINIKDHLGVTLSLVEEPSDYASAVRTLVQAGEDAYQLVMTHGLSGAGTLVSTNCLYNYADFEDVNLDAPYWNQSIMNDAKYGERYLLGYGDFGLSHVHALIFNKDMMKEYNLKEPYQLVDDQKWTLDQFISLASKVAKDNGDGQWDEKDTYGLTGWCGTYMTSFLVASGLNVIENDGEGNYYLAYTKNIDKMNNLIDKLITMGNADYAYLWGGGSTSTVDFTDGTTLFQFYDAADLAILRSSSVRFGVVPFPKWDAAQEDYRCLSMNGFMTVPSVIKNPAMVGQTLELLGYYTAPVKVAFYEDLLGSKLSEAPEDARMLDVIWTHQIFDPIMLTADRGQQMMDAFYLPSTQVSSGQNTLSSKLKALDKSVNNALKAFYKKANQ